MQVCIFKKCFFQIQDAKGDVTITNDGATILKQMQVLHPAARMVRFFDIYTILFDKQIC